MTTGDRTAIGRGPSSLPTDDAPDDRRQGPPPLLACCPLVAWSRWWRLAPPRDSLIVSVKASFSIVPGGPAEAMDPGLPPSGDVYEGDNPAGSLRYGSDLALFKRRADVTLVGHAHAPAGSATAMAVRFRFGRPNNRFDRAMAVFGDRQWVRTATGLRPSEPRRFARMPLCFERAFGGPGFVPNPVGVGFRPEANHPLPNLETPTELIVGPSDERVPICFAPVAQHWEARWRNLGSYGGSYARDRAPFFPKDFDFDFFQAAPRAQQLAPLVGDEPYGVSGVHPEHPVVEGTLPGWRVRAFVHRSRAAGGAFFELPLLLDTVHFDFDALILSLVWRAPIEVSGELAPELGRIWLMHEPTAEPAVDLGGAYERYRTWLALAPAEVDEPEGEPAPANDVATVGLDAQARAADAKLEAILAEVRAASPHAQAAEAASATLPPVPKPDAQALRRLLERPEIDPKDAAELGDLLERVARGEPPGDGPGELELRERAMAMLAAGESFDEQDFTGADWHDLDFSGRSLVGVKLGRANLRGCRFEKANLTRGELGGADARDAHFAEAILEEADLTGAKLEGARFTAATLDRALFVEVDAPAVDFRAVRAHAASFAAARLGGATFVDAELEQGDFAKAALDGANFDGVVAFKLNLVWAKGQRVSFRRARIAGVRAFEAELAKGQFEEVVAPQSNWQGARLDAASFGKAMLTGANLSHVECPGARFDQADLVGARFDHARAHGAALRKANLMTASLEDADFSAADLRGANLYGAALGRIRLEDARLELTNLNATLLAPSR